MPKGHLAIYSMGRRGVNTTTSPVHLEDGDLVQAQNFQPDPAGQDGVLRSRDGMTRLTSSALAGQVTGGIGVPLPDQSALTTHFYAAMDDLSTGTDAFRHSTNGTTWTTITAGTLVRPASLGRAGYFGANNPGARSLRWASLNERMYYPGNDYNDASTTSWPTLHVWDGTTDYKLAEIPHHPSFNVGAADEAAIMAIVPYSSTQLIVSTSDGNDATGRCRVLLMDVATGKFTQLGAGTDLTGYAQSVVVAQGRIWAACAVTNLSQSTIRSVRPDDGGWATERLIVAGRSAESLVVFKGDLYCGQSAAWAGAGNSAIIEKRAASTGAWTTVLTGDGTGTGNILGPLAVDLAESTIFAWWYSVSGGASPENRIVSSTDGTTWGTEYDVKTNVGVSYTQSGYPFLDRATGHLYWPVMQTTNETQLLRRTSGGTWSIVDSSNQLMRGPIASIRF
jgi:hypothetical protein